MLSYDSALYYDLVAACTEEVIYTVSIIVTITVLRYMLFSSWRFGRGSTELDPSPRAIILYYIIFILYYNTLYCVALCYIISYYIYIIL